MADLNGNGRRLSAAYREFAVDNEALYGLMFERATPDFIPSDASRLGGTSVEQSWSSSGRLSSRAAIGAMQQVGGSIGTALLSSIFASAASSFAEGRPPGPQVAADAAMHGYTVAFWVAAGVFAFGAIVVGSLMRSIKVEAHAPGEVTPEPAVAHS
jgi:hypothetical protein